MTDVAEYLDRLPYWDKLSKAEQDLVSENSYIREYKRGDHIWSCGESCLGMLYIIYGSVRVFLLSEEGKEVTLFKLSDGESDVLAAACVIRQITFNTQLTVEEDCSLLIVNPRAFGSLVGDNIHVRCFAFELSTKRFSDAMFILQQILFLRFDQRLATYLLTEADKSGGRTIHKTHVQIAQDINSAREVVARMLKRFSDIGIIEMKRGDITIKDSAQLQSLL